MTGSRFLLLILAIALLELGAITAGRLLSRVPLAAATTAAADQPGLPDHHKVRNLFSRAGRAGTRAGTGSMDLTH